MKKIVLLIFVLGSLATQAQIYTPNGAIQGSSVNNNVGIGTNNPQAPLDIAGENTPATIPVLKLTNPNSLNGAGAQILLGPYAPQYMSSISSSGYPFSTYASNLWLQPRISGGILGNGIFLSTNDNVGIGYTTGTELTNNKLAVNGSGYFNGNLNALTATFTNLSQTTSQTLLAKDASNNVRSTGITVDASNNIYNTSNYYISSTADNDANGNPWYGIGKAGGGTNPVSLNGYYGLRFGTAWGQIYFNSGGAEFYGTIRSSSATFTTGASANTIFSGDAAGNGSWKTVNQIIGGNALTSGYLPYWDGSKLANSGISYNNGSTYFYNQIRPILFKYTPSGDYGTHIYLSYDAGQNQKSFSINTSYNNGNGGLIIRSSSDSQQYGASPDLLTYTNVFEITKNGSVKINNLSGTGTRLVGATSDGTLTTTVTAGNVSSTGTPVANQIPIWTNSNTIKGTSNLTFYDGSIQGLVIFGESPFTRLQQSSGNFNFTNLSYDGNNGYIDINQNYNGSNYSNARFTPTTTYLYSVPNKTAPYILYYNSSTKELSYASAPSGGGMTYPSGSGLTVVSGSSSWGSTISLPNNTTTFLRGDGTFATPPTSSGTITGVSAGTGLTGGGLSGSVTLSLANTAVSPGTYTNANITVDAQGRITSASNGSSGSGGSSGQWTTSGSNIYYTAGNVSIGTNSFPSGYKLAVGGKIIAEEVMVKTMASGWPDYVFGKDYQLKTLPEVENFIKNNGHLPDVPNAKEVGEKGVSLNEMDQVLLKKVEEMTLYSIEQNKQLQAQQEIIRNLEEKISRLEKAIHLNN